MEIDRTYVPRLPHVSAYSFREKIRIALWKICEIPLFRLTPHFMNSWRCFVLRLFGATVGQNTFINSSARIWFPWNFEIGDNSGIGFDTEIYSLDKIYIGNFATIAQRCHLVTGSHDYRESGFRLVTKPINIKAGVFLGADCYVGLGVVIHKMAVIAARSVVIHDMPEYTICGGHPCKPIRGYVVQ